MAESFPIVSTILLGVGGLALGVTAILSTIFMGMWIYHDAKDRGIDNPALWVVLAIVVSNLIGLVIYLVVRSTHNRKNPCPECAFPVPESQGFCPRCGAKQPPLLPPTESNGKAKKNLRRMLFSFGAVALFLILFLVFYFIFVFSLIEGGGNFNHSVLSGTSSYFGTMISSSSNKDSGNLSFGNLNGSYRIMNVRVDDDELLNLSVEFSAEEGTLQLELRGSDKTYTLENGINTFEDLAAGSYKVTAVTKDASKGHVYVERVYP